MPQKKSCSDETFIHLIESPLGIQGTANKLGINERNVRTRRVRLENKLHRQIVSGTRTANTTRVGVAHPGRINTELENGICLIGGDCHYWPGPPSLMHRAFVSFCKGVGAKKTKPKIVILNGDVVDLGQISRHPPIGWEELPTVEDEIITAQERLGEIEKATFKARKIWTLGNHDGRYETRLATVAPEFAKISGVHLRDHFPLWEPCWSVFINDNTVIKHRFKGGLHAPHNNTLWAGRSVITGHLHSQRISPLTDYSGTRYGVDTGCIADPDHKAFVDYTEDNPKNWRDGFVVLTYLDGELLPPELVSRWNENTIVFRGEIIKV